MSRPSLPGLCEGAVAVAVFAALPLWMVGRAIGRFKAPGIGTEMLFGQLLAGEQVRQWFSSGGWFRLDLAGGGNAFWPANSALAAVEAGLEPGLGYGLGVALALFLAGFGPWRLARRLGARALGALAAGLLVQASPPVLRAVTSGELGVLGVGPAALALASGSAMWALLAGAWSFPAGVLVTVVGATGRRWRLLLALLPLIPAMACPPSGVLGSARLAVPSHETVPAYVADNGAVIPLPPAEAARRRPVPGPKVPSGVLADVARLPGGAVVWLMLATGVLLGPRRPALLGLGAGLGWIAVFGLLPVPGSPPAIPPHWLVAAAPWIPGLRPPVGELAWLIPMLAAAVVVTARLVGGAGRRLVIVGLAVLAVALIENPRLRVPVTNLAPGVVQATLSGLPDGGVVVFPSPAQPWRQGRRSPPELLFRLGCPGHALEVGLRPPTDAALMAWLSNRADEPVDAAAAPLVWKVLPHHTDDGSWPGDPAAAAREAGFTALVLDRSALDRDVAARLDAALAARLGRPVVEDATMALYDLTTRKGGRR